MRWVSAGGLLLLRVQRPGGLVWVHMKYEIDKGGLTMRALRRYTTIPGREVPRFQTEAESLDLFRMRGRMRVRRRRSLIQLWLGLSWVELAWLGSTCIAAPA
jgi:hypothetical protein